ncbi:dethiobiotin synthase [Spirulina sp. CCNP1310]|uniref:dethiobiotin synthase n=1 Tax=Spirulina sp. CCNP1310 TaxID=3110249 RepID=UPI002B2062D4|nr:dethiobiotin synthase [Spirulina sp. CCNP1310]MEA5420956.1 dethiobiotin synthase [Spirulina sp. CCNP1310]
MPPLIITGTNTDVGKTVLTTALVAYWHRYRDPQTLGLMKLMQSGPGDGEHYRELFTLPQAPETLVPLQFSAPIAPPLAAVQEGKTVDLAVVWQAYQQLAQDYPMVLIEGVGGLGSPVTLELTVGDVAAMWGWETVLVVPVQLGAIAQTVANIALARSLKLPVRGLVLSCVQPVTPQQLADWTPVDLLESLTQTPVLGTLPYLDHADRRNLATLAQVAAQLDLERLFP